MFERGGEDPSPARYLTKDRNDFTRQGLPRGAGPDILKPVDSITRYLISVVCVIGGALMTFNPPPRDISRAASVPWTGAAIMLGGIGYFVHAVRERSRRGKPTRVAVRKARHASADRRDSMALAAALLGVLGLGGGILWWGLGTGQLSVIGMAVVSLGILVLVSLNVIAVRIWGSPTYPQSPHSD